jgi:hypothetical protein
VNIWTKFLIGLAAALAVGVVSHGPLGRGEGFIDRLDAGAQAVVRYENLPGVTAAMQRDPLARTVLMSGPTNRFQRTGRLSAADPGDLTGEAIGFDARMLKVPGMGAVEWTSEPTGD